jgi:cobalamin biosynthesis Mg chelatase CobN
VVVLLQRPSFPGSHGSSGTDSQLLISSVIHSTNSGATKHQKQGHVQVQRNFELKFHQNVTASSSAGSTTGSTGSARSTAPVPVLVVLLLVLVLLVLLQVLYSSLLKC